MTFFLLVFSLFNSRVVINEVMANPKGSTGPGTPEDRNEFVELYNVSDETINLAGWRITDLDAIDSIVAWTDTVLLVKYPDVIINSTNLPPHAFALILDPEYTTTGIGGYELPYAIPANTLILTVGNTTIGNELQNNDPLLFYSPDCAETTSFGTPLDTIDSFPYSAGDGKSWERVSPTAFDQKDNWRISIDGFGSTPGQKNSIISYKDLALYNFYPLPNQTDSASITLVINVYNKGYQAAQDWQVVIYNDLNFNHREDRGERLFLLFGNLLKPQTDTTFLVNWPSPVSGNNEVWAVLSYEQDQDSTNNQMMTYVYKAGAQDFLKFITNRFSPDQDGYEDTLYIRYEVPAVGGKLNITLFDLRGNEIKTLIQSKIKEKTGMVYWDGKSKFGTKVATGIYLIKLEYKIGSRIYEQKKSVILAKKR
uniref:LTD domain-containing protein n=1 Tax=candidate division WOR-3 bacterium TaxID=2052148 RepID=A0A7C6E9L4_UNCW3